MLVTNIYAIDPKNIGDVSSSPMLYFTFPFEIRAAHATDLPKEEIVNVIFGGGGLLHTRTEMANYICAATGKIASWGMGHNTHGGSKLDWPKLMERFVLHGIRDYGTPYPWVPCVSCMHPKFDQIYQVTNDVVVYDHQNYPTSLKGFLTLKNDASKIDDVIAFLASGETIITSSYHGAYWGTLLGRKVLIMNPFSTKFYHFKHQPCISTPERWNEDRRNAPVFPDALTECRQANREHYQHVLSLFA